MINVGYKRGYRADIELSWADKSVWGITSSHGFSFGNGIYVGGGAGFGAELTKNTAAMADITNKGIRTFANPAIGLDIARFSLKVGYEYQLGFWGHLDGKHMHNVKLGVAYTF